MTDIQNRADIYSIIDDFYKKPPVGIISSLEFFYVLYFPKNDRQQLIAGYLDGKVKFWALDFQEIANTLWCKFLQHEEGFTSDEQLKYLGNISPSKREFNCETINPTKENQ